MRTRIARRRKTRSRDSTPRQNASSVSPFALDSSLERLFPNMDEEKEVEEEEVDEEDEGKKRWGP